MSSNDGMLIDFDNMLHRVGDFGKYQIILMLLFSVINVLSGFHYFGQTFISVVPEFKCKNSNINSDITITSQCSIFVQLNDTYQENSCSDGWNYNNTHGYISIIEELNWVCGDDWKPAVGQSVFFIGSVIGSLVFGVLADRIGRLHALVAANMFAFFGNISTIFSKNVTIFAISRFLAGCATDTNFVMMYIIVMEYIRPSMRTFGLNICIGVFYCLSCVVVPWIAVLLGIWKKFLLAISIPHIIVLAFYLFVPESAQWLISKGRTKEAIECFKRIAKINNKKIDHEYFEALEKYCSQNISTATNKHESLLGLIKTPKLRRKTLILTFKSMVMTLCYDAISRNVNGLSYSPFAIFSITSSTILPACLFILVVQDRVGRKALASGSLLLSGIFTVCSGIIQSLSTTNSTTILILTIIARLGINVAYNSGHQYAVELIPTVVRGQGVSAIHVAGYAASFFSPQILYLGTIWKPSPEVILGTLLVLGAIACLFLPETLHRTLPVTLQDGEEFGEDEKIFQFACYHATSESMTTLTSAEQQTTRNYCT